jgi:hypothetical protein
MTAFRYALLLTTLLAACSRPPEPPEHVTHEERALAKANAAWADAFARRADEAFSPPNIQRFAPYRVTLDNGVWMVRTAAGAELHGRAPSAVILASDGTTYVASVER